MLLLQQVFDAISFTRQFASLKNLLRTAGESKREINSFFDEGSTREIYVIRNRVAKYAVYAASTSRFSACTVAFRLGMLGYVHSFENPDPRVSSPPTRTKKSARGKSAITTFPTDYSPLYPLITCKVGDAATKQAQAGVYLDEVNQTFEKERGGILTGSFSIESTSTCVPYNQFRDDCFLSLFFFESTFRNGEIITVVLINVTAFCQAQVIDVYLVYTYTRIYTYIRKSQNPFENSVQFYLEKKFSHPDLFHACSPPCSNSQSQSATRFLCSSATEQMSSSRVFDVIEKRG